MTTLNLSAAPLQEDTVARLNRKAALGYIRDQSGANEYIFIIGFALKHSQTNNLSIGAQVQFRVSDKRRVDELVVEKCSAAAA